MSPRYALMAAAFVAAVFTASRSEILAQAPIPGFEPQLEDIETLPAGVGREETFYGCTACHAFKLVAAQGMTGQLWDETIQVMIDKHKMNEPTQADRAAMIAYLEKHYPPRTPRGGWQNPFAQ
jgi:cytochrome c2